MKKEYSIPDIIYILLFGLTMLLLFSCTSTKNVATKHETIDSTALNEKSDSIRVLLSEVYRLTQEIHELQYAGVVFDSSRCPPSIINVPKDCNVDSIMALLDLYKNKVTIYADGKIEAEGKLKSAYYTKDKLSKMIAELQHINDSLRLVKAKTETIVKTEIVEKEKKVKRRFLTMWWLYLIFFCGGWYVRHRFGNILSFIKL
jgi:hypothetical protein